jgi:hypothetical protein
MAPSGTCNAGCPFGRAANGDAITLWGEIFNTNNFVLKANRYSAQSGTWDSGQIISASTGNILIENPQLAVSTNGNAVAIWEQYSDVVIRKDIWASYYTAGGGWSAATLVESDNTGRAVTPQVAIDANGNAKAVWVQFDASLNTSIMVSATSNGNWSTPSALEAGTGTVRSSPQIAFGANGQAMAVWSSYTGPGNSLRASVFTGTWAAPVSVWSESVLSQLILKPRVVLDANGNAIAVWQEPTGNGGTGTYLNIKANRYVAGMGWGTAELIEWNQYDASHPRIAMDANGNAMVVWVQSDSVTPHVWANLYSVSSNSWGASPINLQTGAVGSGGTGSVYGASPAFVPIDIAFDANGNAMAVWSEFTVSTPGRIFVNRYTPGSGWGLLNDNAIPQISITGANMGEGASYPRVAFDTNGGALVVWTQYVAGTDRLWFNLYQ